jgi:hypothetical protein
MSCAYEWGYYPNGTEVRVTVPDDPNHRRVGTVYCTRLDDTGEMEHTVRFGGGETARYITDELTGTRGSRWGYPEPQPDEQD